MRNVLRMSVLAGVLAVGVSLMNSSTASAQFYGSGPIYHGQGFHYDRVYVPTVSHWTPWQGYHSHGFTVNVPHYTPGFTNAWDRGRFYGNPGVIRRGLRLGSRILGW